MFRITIKTRSDFILILLQKNIESKNPALMKYEMLTDFKIMSDSRLARILVPIICVGARVLMWLQLGAGS